MAIAFVTIVSGGCSSESKPNASSSTVEVEVAELKAAPAQITQDLPGRVVAMRSAQVRARVEGVIEKQLFVDGAEVKAGSPLFQIDPRNYQATAEAAEADLATQRALMARYAPLLTTKAISAQEYEVAKARLKAAEAAYTKARLDLDNSRALSPISGRAGRSLVTEGALVGKGDATHLVTVEQLHPIRVEFSQPYADLLAMKKYGSHAKAVGQVNGIELLLEDGSRYPQTGQIKFSDLAVDPSTGAVAMRAEFPNPERTLLPGTFVRVRLPVAGSDHALRVPQRAVSTSAKGQSVMVVGAENKVEHRTISTLGFVGTDYLVANGLAPGERVIVNGLQKVKPGDSVTPVPVAPVPNLAQNPT